MNNHTPEQFPKEGFEGSRDRSLACPWQWGTVEQMRTSSVHLSG